jgi:hypothetical protein
MHKTITYCRKKYRLNLGHFCKFQKPAQSKKWPNLVTLTLIDKPDVVGPHESGAQVSSATGLGEISPFG